MRAEGIGLKRKAPLIGLFTSLTSLLAALFLLPAALPAAAEGAFYSYTYDNDGNVVAAPDAVTADVVLTGVALGTANLANPSDLFVDENGDIYIVDTDNNRIVIVDREWRFVREIASVSNGEEALTFQKPQGIYIHETGIYVADTNNARIVVLDREDRLLRILAAPESSSLPDTFDYKPTKVLVDTAGRIFVTSSGFNMGLIEMDKNGDFVGCLGANAVTVTPWDYFLRMISTDEMIERMASFVPTEYNNINIDEDDFIYVTSNSYPPAEYSAGTASPVRKLNAKGNDILRTTGAVKPYGDPKVMATGSYRGASSLVDVCTMGYGMYAVLDSNRCRAFVYNADGELLFEFGSPGSVKGGLQVPTALEYRDGRFYVLDSGKMSLTVYAMSDYGQKLYDTARCHYQSLYDEEAALWAEIARQNINSASALSGLGKAAYRNKNFSEALRYFRLAEDRSNYSSAFKMVRMETMGDVFPYVMTGLVVLCAVGFVFSRWRKRHPARPVAADSYRGTLRYSRYVIFHPFDGFWDLKCEKRGSMKAAVTLLALACAAMAVYSRFIGFPFGSSSADEVNLLLEAMKVAGPLLLFCACNWCVTSLMNGEGSFRDIFMASSYALTPLVILLPIATLFSNVLVEDEGDFFLFLVTLAFCWTIALVICANRQIHDYTMGKTLLVILITLLVMVIVLFLAVLAFALANQFVSFISDLQTEISMRL